MRKLRHVVCLSVIALLVPIGVMAQQELTPLDVVTLKSVSGVYPSPDGTRIAFTRTEPRTPDDSPGSSYNTLHMLDENGNEHALAVGKRNVGGVSWSPDGASVTFLERREGDVGRQLYALPVGGGEGDPSLRGRARHPTVPLEAGRRGGRLHRARRPTPRASRRPPTRLPPAGRGRRLECDRAVHLDGRCRCDQAGGGAGECVRYELVARREPPGARRGTAPLD
ncbi:MAG: hypothetical protein GTO22_05965 [Gemmatimonadales bacterium]|nr:hypothetical protein [Gemmatimonadales bacterium]